MANYAWEFGAQGSGLWFTITYDDVTNELTVHSLEGKFDLNALWFGDGVADGLSPSLSKKDSSLNMNGSGVDWDGYIKLSDTGLGPAGENKNTFISAGETATFDLDNFGGAAAFEAALASSTFQIGVRATSVNGGGSIKSVGEEIPLPTIDVTKAASPETFNEGTATDITYTYTVANTSQHITFDNMSLTSLIDDGGAHFGNIDLLTGFVVGSSYGTYYDLTLNDGVTFGDLDGDYLLDIGEVWYFTYVREDVVENAGWTNTNTVTAKGEVQNIEVEDDAIATVEAVNVDPIVYLEKSANPASVEDVGNVTYTYVVTSGSVSTDPLTLVSLIDDMGTPGNTGDDVDILLLGTFQGGDANSNGLLDFDETWTYTYQTNVTIADGQSLTNTAVVTARDDEGNEDTDDATATVDGGSGGFSLDFPEYEHKLGNVVFYLDTNGLTDGGTTNTNGGIIKVKVNFTGDDEFDVDDTTIESWLFNNYLDGSPNAYTLLAYSIHAGNEYYGTDGSGPFQATGANGGPGKDPINASEGPSVYAVYGDGDTLPDYNDATKIAGPAANADMTVLGITDAVLGANANATFTYDGTTDTIL